MSTPQFFRYYRTQKSLSQIPRNYFFILSWLVIENTAASKLYNRARHGSEIFVFGVPSFQIKEITGFITRNFFNFDAGTRGELPAR